MIFKRFHAAVSAVLIIILICMICTASAENLLSNPDFIHIGSDGLPEGWDTDAYISEPGYSVFSLSEGDSEHPIAISIQNIGENDARFRQTVEVEPDSLYCLSGYIKAEDIEGGHGANLSVEGIYAFSDKCFDTEGEWEYIEYYGETGPEQHAVTVFARLGGYSGTSTGKAYFADLSLTKADSVPGDGIADLWYIDSSFEDYADDDESYSTPMSYRTVMILIMILYVTLALAAIYRNNQKTELQSEQKPVSIYLISAAFLFSFLLRLVIAWFTEGYMVDVNCFLSWGRTMATYGPAGFYEATNFCDYPPLYTYALALNSAVSQLFPGSAGFSRIIFRLIPTLCDLAGCLILYSVLLQQKEISSRSCFLFLVFALFNPAIILNSAAWGQMDSVLCLLLVCVALLSVKGKWKAVLPLYVAAVLIKPQALMLGPLGLVYIIITLIKNKESRKPMLIGTYISLLTLAAGVIPFSIQQNWDWLIQLYIRTLGSYRYATVNTANLYYILGGNWSAVDGSAHFLAPVIMSILCAGYGIWWYLRAEDTKYKLVETVISCAFSIAFIILCIINASWALVGALAMAYAFVIVISPAVRTGNIRILPWLGGLLYVLLYVFGVKMHERYVFPALLLLAYAWVLKKDRRILYVLLLFSLTLFTNQYIVLDNSMRLGSSMGHLNKDTVWLADVVSVINILGSLYAVWLGLDMYIPGKKRDKELTDIRIIPDMKGDNKLYWNKKDTILLTLITVIFSTVSLLTLGSNKAPQSVWSSSSATEQIIFDLGEKQNNIEVLYFGQVSRKDFSVSASNDGVNWSDETWAQMDQGQCWKWKYVTESYDNGDGTRSYFNSDESHIIRFTGRYFRLTSQQLGLKLNEVLFRDPAGNILPVEIVSQLNAEPASELYSDAAALIDEQETMEGLPAFPPGADTENGKIQPSWWNSTYFDEIYHARTGYEFLQGSVPYETTHPPLGKVFISLWIAVFGMTPFGWRFAGALAGILMLPGMYLIGKQLTKKTWIAVLSCLMMALDCMHLTQTQISTIDSFPVLFIIFSYYFMLRFIQTDITREKLHVSLISLAFSGLFMGLSIASKWIGIYAGAGLAILFFWHCCRMIRLAKTTSKMSEYAGSTDEESETPDVSAEQTEFTAAMKRILIICAWCVLFFVIIPVIIYLISYIPYLAYNYKQIHSFGDYLNEVWRCQINMLNYHSTPGLGMDHPFYSPWWQWPIMGKPMYYASKQYLPVDYPVHHSIFAFGNPVIWFSSLAALLICLCREIIRRRYRTAENSYLWHIRSKTYDSRYIFMLIGLLAQYLPWVPVPRGTYIYHYFASIPFLMTAICLCFDFKDKRKERIGIILSSVFIGLAAVFFIILFPYASGMNVPDGWLDFGRLFARIWY